MVGRCDLKWLFFYCAFILENFFFFFFFRLTRNTDSCKKHNAFNILQQYIWYPTETCCAFKQKDRPSDSISMKERQKVCWVQFYPGHRRVFSRPRHFIRLRCLMDSFTTSLLEKAKERRRSSLPAD